MLPPLFLEVDPEDEVMIRHAFPDADIHSGVLEGDELLKVCQDRDVICCFIYTHFTRSVIDSLPALRCLCTRSVGYNHIDMDACRARGILVCNVPDYGSHVIAEHVFALLLSALRHVSDAERQVKEGNFDYHGLRGMALMGKTIGIIGTGKIGMKVARIASGFGMKIYAVDTCRVLELESEYGVRYVDLPTLLAHSDIVTLHVPSLPTTKHMMNMEAFALMKDGVILVNTARGELIDSTALVEALRSGKVAQALLDVLEHEKDFAWNKELITHPNVIVTPHIAFYADDSMQKMYTDAFHSIHQYRAGEHPDHATQVSTIVCDLPGIQQNMSHPSRVAL